MEFTIRPMKSSDIPEVFAIDKASAALYWPERSYHFEVEKNDASRPFVATGFDGEILGFIVFWLIIDEAHLANFAVSEPSRRKGIGRALLLQGLKTCYNGGARVSFLEVRAGNIPAIRTYEKLGFRTEGCRPGFYEAPKEDALIMWRRPPEETDESRPGTDPAGSDFR